MNSWIKELKEYKVDIYLTLIIISNVKQIFNNELREESKTY